MNKLQRIAPAWHEEAKKIASENFARDHAAFLDSTKRAVWWGLFFNHVKQRGKEDGSIPHGEFGPWLKKNIPQIHWDTVCTYMRLARDVAERGKFQISEFPKFDHCGDLPQSITSIVEGKTQQQLCLEFKQMELGDDGEFHVKHGRLKGQGGSEAQPTTNIEEIVKFNQKYSIRQMGLVDQALGRLGVDFMGHTDEIIGRSADGMRRTLRCMDEWLKTPPARRDMKAIQKLYRNS